MDYFLLIILVLNTLWFGAGFHFFAIKSEVATKLLLKKGQREEPYFSVINQAVKFLGGFNLALMVLSILCLSHYQHLFENPMVIGLFFVFFTAHFSQFWYNVPYAMEESKGRDVLWSVLSGRMYFIFKTDFILAILNLLMCFLLLF